MNETILGVISGGALSFAITLVERIFSAHSLKKQFKHETELRKLELFEAERVAAIADYSSKLMLIYSKAVVPVNEYYLAAGRALAYVSAPTRELIYLANIFINTDPRPAFSEFKPYNQLISALNDELVQKSSEDKRK